MSFAFFPALFCVADARARELGNLWGGGAHRVTPGAAWSSWAVNSLRRRSRREAALAGAMNSPSPGALGAPWNPLSPGKT